MNKLEFKTILNVFGIEEKTIKIGNGRYGQEYTIFYWNEITFIFDGTNYSIISGSIPTLVSKTMLKEYPSYHDLSLLFNKENLTDIAANRFLCGNSKVGLIHLLSELKYYSEKGSYKKETRKTFYKDQGVIMDKVGNRLINICNPYHSPEDWGNDYKMAETTKDLLTYIKAFDETVNPFCNFNYEMKSPKEYMDNVVFSLNKDEKDTLKMDISDSHCKVSYLASKDEKGEYMAYCVSYNINQHETMTIRHYISRVDGFIKLYTSNVNDPNNSKNKKIDITYDLGSGNVYSNNGEKSIITLKQIDMINSELRKATAAAKKVTLDNMAKSNFLYSQLLQKIYQKNI